MRRGGHSLTHSARTPPAVHPGMTIWGVKGGSSPQFFVAKSYFLFTIERHAKIQNRRQTPSGRMPAVRPEMTIWEVKGGSPPFFVG